LSVRQTKPANIRATLTNGTLNSASPVFAGKTFSSIRSLPLKRFLFAICGLFFLAAVGLIAYGSICSIRFDQNCKGYLKRAADANTLKLAEQELGKAVNYLEQTGLTEGDTSILYSTPRCDIGFWYDNLRASLDELRAMPSDVDQLTISSHLLKLRESIMDTGEKGTRVTVPPNIDVFPNQAIYRVVGGISTFGLLATGLGLAIVWEADCRNRKPDQATC